MITATTKIVKPNKEEIMETISARGLGFALGGTGALLYIACAFIMMTVPPEASVAFFNNITHGVDWGPIMRWDMPWWEMVVGMLQVFILGWLTGAVIATFYNIGRAKKSS